MSTTPKSVTQRYIMPKASQIQFFFARFGVMVIALWIRLRVIKKIPSYIKILTKSRKPLLTLTHGLCILAFALSSTSANADSTQKRWYRYYDDRGVPTISGSVSEQHMLHGYDVLDSTLNVMRHVAPFSTSRYDQEQAQRQQAIERRIADRHLLETYVSSSRAATQRDRELSDIDGQITRSQQQSEGINIALNANITNAANLERQGIPIAAGLRNQLAKNRSMLAQSETNIAALKIKRAATEQQFNRDIATLKRIEQQGGSAPVPTPNE